MRAALVWLMATAWWNAAAAQDTLERPGNALYLELLGTGPVASVNYERLLFQNEALFVSGRVAAGTYVLGYEFPHSVYLNIGKRRDYFEIGFTGVYMHTFSFFSSKPNDLYFVSPSAGYKRWGMQRLFFRAAFTPYLDINGETSRFFTPMGGLGIGYAF